MRASSRKIGLTVAGALAVAGTGIAIAVNQVGTPSGDVGPSVGTLPSGDIFQAMTESVVAGRKVFRPVHISELPAGRASIRLPRGMNYSGGLAALYSASKAGKLALPAGFSFASPLPKGRVLKEDDQGSVLIDSRAPAGYDPKAGWVTPVAVITDDPTKAGGRIFVPALPDCQTIRAGQPDSVSDCPTSPIDLSEFAEPK